MTQKKVWFALSFLSFLIVFGCALKPRPIYKDYPHDRHKKEEATIEKPAHGDSKEPGKTDTKIKNQAEWGDRGVTAADAPYQNASLASTQSLKASAEVWQLANELIPFLHTPYKYGGEDTLGVDCSGLVKVVFSRAFGLDLPHKAAYQYKMGKPVAKMRLTAGDLIFFYDKKYRRINHVGLYLDNGQFIHSVSSKGVVISNLNQRYWKKYFAGARRFLAD